ncbi:SDR family oxidoreductase [Aquihabitans sp. McL0605]|uniref:SDR family oxidoreductase n=1 Tax=Aquihabitans sp. McL0605 TaxID=3415671 RepID=UPI003CFA35BC
MRTDRDRSRPTGPGRGTAVVTGASAGVGRATAVALAAAGFDVALLARGAAGLRGALAEVEAEGRRGLIVAVDVADADAVVAAAQRVEAELGPIDVWVNDAMTTVFAPSWEIEPDDFARAVDVTFLGQVWGTLAALAIMRPRDRGAIVNVGSALSYVGIPLQSAYCASKFACRGFFESTRAELIHEGSSIRMSMVHLPAVNTPQFGWCRNQMDRHPQPVPPIYQPEVIARKIVAVVLDGRRTRVVGSWNRLVVLMGRLAPGLGNHYVARGAWESQLTSTPSDPSRPANLRHPVDATEDAGPRGIFGDRSGGFLDPSFLRSLPSAAATLGGAVAGLVREELSWRRRRWSGRH